MAVNFQQQQRRRGKGRPFEKGVSGNPAGRPAGSRNAATEMAQALLDGEAETLVRRCVELALQGNPAAMKLETSKNRVFPGGMKVAFRLRR